MKDATFGKIIVRYPPDYDGELHIETKRKSTCESLDEISFSFVHACKKTETEKEVLVKAANAILKQFS